MNARRFRNAFAVSLIAWAGSAVALPGAMGREQNVWPFVVRQKDSTDRVTSWNGAGPFAFRQPADDGGTVSGFRPLWLQRHNEQGDFRAAFFLYPLFSYTVDEDTYRWSLFEIVRRWGRRSGAAAPQSIFDQRGEFEVFPLWFSRQGGDPEMSYRGLFPVYGTIKNKLWFERLSWTLFPLHVENEKRGAVTTSTPWPIVRVTRGAAQGWGVWPLYNHVTRPGVSEKTHILWPLGYNVRRFPEADAPAGTAPRHDIGALPFYTRSTGPGYINEDFAWPFFGYTDRTGPTQYHEARYFWPFLVQGRGDNRFVNRWGPFYTRSIVKGYDKTWYAWPVVRRARWADEGILRTKTQVLYFLYHHQRQESIARPGLAAAELTHVWPLWSTWDNGAGRRQWQFLSPFAVFFPQNEKVRHLWSPLFALARHDGRAPGDSRTSLLWDAVTWERRREEGRREFHLGPLLSVVSAAGTRRVSIGSGLVGLRQPAGGGWRMFWFDFRGRRQDSN
ncbi:MAG: hypothetical protein WD941_06470 [Opitutus sp.]